MRLTAILQELPKRPLLAGDEGIRFSLAGAQDKVAVLIEQGEVYLALGGAPSTHILKPAVERFEGVVFNEALCMKLAAQAGLPAASVETMKVNGIDCLIVERYDRIHKKGPDAEPTIERLHQEDFCQAQGMVSEHKYQKEGSPSLKPVLPGCCAKVSSTPVIDLMPPAPKRWDFTTTSSAATTLFYGKIFRCSITASARRIWK